MWGASYLALGVFILLDAVAGLCHRLFDHPDGVRPLRGGIDAFLGDEGRDFLPQRSKIVVSLLLADLDFTFLEDLYTEINQDLSNFARPRMRR